jgi:exosome complex exonuclease DIS3/RRP44
VVLSVVLEEVKNKNLSLYNRLRAIIDNPTRHFFVFANEHHKDTYIKALAGETPNDRNDRGNSFGVLSYCVVLCCLVMVICL